MINNSVKLIGRLTANPLESQTKTGTKSATFTLAVDDKSQKNETTYFIFCKAFGKTADIILNWTGKGDKVAVEGKLVTSRYEDKNGKTVYSTNVFVNEVMFLERKKQTSETSAPAAESDYSDFEPTFDVPFDDGVEF